MATNETSVKKSLVTPVVFTIKVSAKRISDKGTFSGLDVISVTSETKGLEGLRVAAPFQGGGAMYLKVDALTGLKVGEAKAAEKPEARKLW